MATFNFSYFIGAFYLYTINCFFICIATFLVIKYLKYPAAAAVNPKYEKRIRYGITILIMVMIIPSFYLAYNLWNEKKFTKTVEEFINTEFNNKGYTLIYKKLSYNTNPRIVDLAFLNKKLSKEEMAMYNRLLKEKGIGNAVLNFRQDDADLKSEILNELSKQDASVSEKDLTINSLRQELEKFKINEPNLIKEIGILFPNLTDIQIGKIERYPATDSVRVQHVVLYSQKNEIQEEEIYKLRTWLQNRLNTQDVMLTEISE